MPGIRWSSSSGYYRGYLPLPLSLLLLQLKLLFGSVISVDANIIKFKKIMQTGLGYVFRNATSEWYTVRYNGGLLQASFFKCIPWWPENVAEEDIYVGCF